MSKIYSENTDVISVNKGHEFGIKLTSSGSSGYRWELKADQSYEILKSGHEVIPNLNSFGGAGKEVFFFRANKSGIYNIEFNFRAPWEPEPEKTILFKVEVT